MHRQTDELEQRIANLENKLILTNKQLTAEIAGHRRAESRPLESNSTEATLKPLTVPPIRRPTPPQPTISLDGYLHGGAR